MKILNHFLVLTAALFSATCQSKAASLDVLTIPGVTLLDNPLHDPAERRVAVFSPDDSTPDQRIPMVIYLPGWGGSSEEGIASGKDYWIGGVVGELTRHGAPLRIAVVDGRSRYGGSQFLNSTATGRYADYISEEILPALTARYATIRERQYLAGHSSGAYGALLLTMRQQDKFSAVVALSPDSDFDETHKPLVQDPAVRAVTRVQLEAAMTPLSSVQPLTDGLPLIVMGLCANYAPTVGQPGRFEWLYDDRGAWRPEAWQRWLDLDPLVLVRNNPQSFLASQRIYLDGADHDAYGANIGARKIQEVLRKRNLRSTFYEFPGQHSDLLPERLVRGLTWITSN